MDCLALARLVSASIEFDEGAQMVASTTCEALRQGKCLELRYDSYSRTVEVHAVGRSKEGHFLMRVWQMRGGSVSNEPVGWKLFRLDEIRSIHITQEKSLAPRNGFKRNDSAMKGRILCQV